MANVSVKCPRCGKSYLVPGPSLGKKGKCKGCSHIFVLGVETDPPAQEEEPLGAVVLPESDNTIVEAPVKALPPPPGEKKGFLAKMNELAEQSSRRVAARYIQGPWGISPNGVVTVVLEDDKLLVKSGIFDKKEFSVAYQSITGVTIDTAERLGKLRTLGAWALAGPLAAAFVGFGIKKKDIFLKLDFTDDTGVAVSAIFGGAGAQSLQGRIIRKKHDYLLRMQNLPETSAVAEEDSRTSASAQPSGAATMDIAANIENLARLRDKGVLSEQEFQAKKTELLARL